MYSGNLKHKEDWVTWEDKLAFDPKILINCMYMPSD